MAEKKELKDLKVGDYVIFKRANFEPILSKIKRITPKGFIDVGGILYDPRTGMERSSDTYNLSYISVPTENDIEKIRHKQKRKILNFGINQILNLLSNEKLEQVYDFIRGLDDGR